MFGKQLHSCQKDSGVNLKVKIRKEILDRVKRGDTANEGTVKVVEEVMMKNYKKNEKLPQPSLLTRVANRHRAKQFPPNPNRKDPSFDLKPYLGHESMPKGFEYLEIWAGPPSDRRRHILFATETPKKYLNKAVQWYIDGTFKLVDKLFKQMFSAHGFILKNGEFKQIPLAFCLMTRRERIDYHAILQEIEIWLDDPIRL